MVPLVRGQWLAQQETLDLVATERTDDRQLVFGFDALGRGRKMQAMRQAYDRLHQGLRAGGPVDAPHEALVDFQVVNRQTLQVTERRVTRAEIVDGDAHAQRPQFGDRSEEHTSELQS